MCVFPGAYSCVELQLLRCFNMLTACLSQRGLNQEATIAAESHLHPYNTPLSKEAAINCCTAHSTLAITLSPPVYCTSWLKELGSGSCSGAKSRAISRQYLALTGKSLQYLSEEGEGVLPCQQNSKFKVWECARGGNMDKTELQSGEINSSC